MQRRKIAFTLCLGLAVMLFSSAALAQYQLRNLVSNQVGAAGHTDPLIVNAWGLVRTPSSPFWIADEGSGWSTLYDGHGVARSLRVEIPPGSAAGPGPADANSLHGCVKYQVQRRTTLLHYATL